MAELLRQGSFLNVTEVKRTCSLQFLVLSHKNAKMILRILQGLVQLEMCIVYKNSTNFEAFFVAKFYSISYCPSLHNSVHRQQRLKQLPF